MRLRRIALRLGLIFATATATSLLFAMPASAAPMIKVYESGSALRIDAEGAGRASLVIEPVMGGWTVTGVNLGPGWGCSRTAPYTVFCGDPITEIGVSLGDTDDSIDIDPHGLGPAIRYAVLAGGGDDVVLGGPGNGVYRGGDCDDFLAGRGGDDNFMGNMGADIIVGGAGRDVVVYDDKTEGIVADLDGAAGDDGTPGEGDSLSGDIEGLVGTNYADVLVGNAYVNTLVGCRGPDKIYGLANDDKITPDDGCPPGGLSTGPDIIDGGPGSDWLIYGNPAPSGSRAYIDLDNQLGDDGYPGEGDSNIDMENIYSYVAGTFIGNDAANWIGLASTTEASYLYGRAGNDILTGAYSTDWLWGEDGNDTLYGWGGADRLYGGSGKDFLDAGPAGTLVNGGPDADECVRTDTVIYCETIT